MKKWIKKSSSICLLLVTSWTYSQNLPLDTWRNHFSYNSGRMIAAGESRIFCATQNGLFYYNKSDQGLHKLSKIDGLSDAGLSAMAYDPIGNKLILGYPSGLIDIVTENEIITLHEINKTNLQGSKRIEDISIHENKAYVSTSFGIITISLTQDQITDTFGSIGKNGSKVTVFDTEVVNNQLFAITGNGIQSGHLSTNLLDFNNWTHYPETAGENYKDFAILNDTVYTVSSQLKLEKLDSGVWKEVLESTVPIKRLKSLEESLYILTETAVVTFDGISFTDTLSILPARNANDFLFDEGFWVADDSLGMVNPSGKVIHPNGPLSDNISRVRVLQNETYTFYAPRPESYVGEELSNFYSSFDLYEWSTNAIEGFCNISDVALVRDQKYFSSIGDGLYNATTQSLIVLNENDLGYGVMIPKIETKNRILYAISYDNDVPLNLINTEGSVTEVTSSTLGTDAPVDLSISSNNVLWITRSAAAGGGIVVTDLEDSQIREITTADMLHSNNINAVSINNADEAWIATAGGPSFFGSASFVFNNLDAINPIYEGYTLFDDINISAIASDGGNRTWIANNEGIWVFDDAITRVIHHFSMDNSPLPSNRVLQFEYNPQNGEMFILTDKGLVSYRSSSSNNSLTHQNTNIFPNPVRPGFTGLVGVTGLTYEASVKVTDINGKLIRELEVNGGTASWDLRDYNNQRVASGVYILLSSSFDGEQTYIGKLAVIN